MLGILEPGTKEEGEAVAEAVEWTVAAVRRAKRKGSWRA